MIIFGMYLTNKPIEFVVYSHSNNNIYDMEINFKPVNRGLNRNTERYLVYDLWLKNLMCFKMRNVRGEKEIYGQLLFPIRWWTRLWLSDHVLSQNSIA